MLRYLTAGESHGPALTAIVEGMPAGLEITTEYINKQLARRQMGYGRGGRMRIEEDQVTFFSGVRNSKTLGSPITLMISNRDWENWKAYMHAETAAVESRRVHVPRPGHGDLAGSIKYGHSDMRNVLERASARETAARVAACSVARRLIEHFGMVVESHVVQIGSIQAAESSYEERQQHVPSSPLFCADPTAEEAMMKAIDQAKENGDSLGGVFEIIIHHVPAGLGSHVHWDRRLDSRLAGALMSIQAIKGVEVGLGFQAAATPGSRVHDEIHYDGKRLYRPTNRAGGIEAGISNGENIVLRAAMKPIATLYRPLPSVDLDTMQSARATVERSDICAVPAAAVVGEAVVAFEIARAFLEKFGGDNLQELDERLKIYRRQVQE
ncbi:MAG TPA: chorismate synthase [Syntrophomonadaceae bacterium]|nr:chorismate synthase [Syntrophomonadaceae bacterium]